MTLRVEIEQSIATLTLDDPDRRNALGLAMFDAVDAALKDVRENEAVRVVLLTGSGSAFCSGFDLAAAVEDPGLIATYINRLSALLRSLRRLPQVVVAAVHGAAIAGGCAIVSACDFVFVATDAQLGYPVHGIGVSPAVTIPTLGQSLGNGAMRALLMSGRIIDGREAVRIGLASHLVRQAMPVPGAARAFCEGIVRKPPHAMRITKAWINELDGSLEDSAFDAVAAGSAKLAHDAASIALLRDFWSKRQR